MSRTYTLKKRAEQQAETRRRIVAAAVDLHGSIGPALTTFSQIAERASVQRHTLYAHFPDERSLYLACSGFVMERDPLPDPDAWRGIADVRARLSGALAALYGWYARNATLIGCVLRDAEHHALTREINELRMGPVMDGYRAVLSDGLTARQRALLPLALSFFTWRSLVRDGELDDAAATDAMTRAIDSAR
jgi:AcrR family transcriptional regulator